MELQKKSDYNQLTVGIQLQSWDGQVAEFAYFPWAPGESTRHAQEAEGGIGMDWSGFNMI